MFLSVSHETLSDIYSPTSPPHLKLSSDSAGWDSNEPERKLSLGSLAIGGENDMEGQRRGLETEIVKVLDITKSHKLKGRLWWAPLRRRR